MASRNWLRMEMAPAEWADEEEVRVGLPSSAVEGRLPVSPTPHRPTPPGQPWRIASRMAGGARRFGARDVSNETDGEVKRRIRPKKENYVAKMTYAKSTN